MRDQGDGSRGIGIRQAEHSGGTALRDPRPVPLAPRRRGRASGPRPVRPRVVSATVRPAQPAYPVVPVRLRSGDHGLGAPGRRVLLRPVPVLPARILRRRRVAAAIGMALLTAAVVVLLGMLADVAAAARASGGHGPATGPSLTEVVTPSGQVVGVARR